MVPPKMMTPLILHYEQLNYLRPVDIAELVKARLGKVGVVLDECHAIKNPGAARTYTAWERFHSVPYKVLISATPIRNRTSELWAQLAFLDPERFGSWPQFAMRYCDGRWVKVKGVEERVLQADGTSNWDELLLRLQPILLRRSYSEVGLELPPITRTLLPLAFKSGSMDREEGEFLRAIREWVKVLRSSGISSLHRNDVLAAITRFKHASAVEKLPMVREWLMGRGQVVVLTSFATVAAELYKQMPESLLLTGAIPLPQREALLEQFRESELPLIATIATGGEGLNLQSGHEVAFIDLPWSPSEILQAEQRVWRQGQEHPVVATYFVRKGKAEEHIVRTLLGKENSNPLGGRYRDTFEGLLSILTEVGE